MFSNKIMSNSEFFLVRECREETEFNFLIKPVAEFQDQDQEPEEKNQEWCECKESSSSSSSSTESICSVFFGDQSKVINDDDDDGFKTPESLDHKIPVIKICPPAPRKTKILSTKRKASSNVRRNLQLDLCREVELLFPRPVLADFYNKIKKARTDPAN